MKTTKTVTALILVFVLVFLMLATGCGSTGDTTLPTQESDEPRYDPNLPTQLEEYKNPEEERIVSIIYYDHNDGMPYNSQMLWLDPDSKIESDTWEHEYLKSVIDRNQTLTEEYAIKIEHFSDPTAPSAIAEQAKYYFDSQDPGVDIVCNSGNYDFLHANLAHYEDISKIKNSSGENIVDLNKSYWNKALVEGLNKDEALYFVTDDSFVRTLASTYCVWINVTLYNELVSASYGGKDITKVVELGNWTFDTMLEMMNTAGRQGAQGLAYDLEMLPKALLSGFDILLPEDAAGRKDAVKPVADAIKRITENHYAKLYTESPGGYAFPTMDAFLDVTEQGYPSEKGNTLFTVGVVGHGKAYKDRILGHAAIPLPMPKLTAEQNDYVCGVDDAITAFSISKYSDAKVEAAILLEAIAYTASTTTRTAYLYDMFQHCRCLFPYNAHVNSVLDKAIADPVVLWRQEYGFDFAYDIAALTNPDSFFEE